MRNGFLGLLSLWCWAGPGFGSDCPGASALVAAGSFSRKQVEAFHAYVQTGRADRVLFEGSHAYVLFSEAKLEVGLYDISASKEVGRKEFPDPRPGFRDWTGFDRVGSFLVLGQRSNGNFRFVESEPAKFADAPILEWEVTDAIASQFSLSRDEKNSIRGSALSIREGIVDLMPGAPGVYLQITISGNRIESLKNLGGVVLEPAAGGVRAKWVVSGNTNTDHYASKVYLPEGYHEQEAETAKTAKVGTHLLTYPAKDALLWPVAVHRNLVLLVRFTPIALSTSHSMSSDKLVAGYVDPATGQVTLP